MTTIDAERPMVMKEPDTAYTYVRKKFRLTKSANENLHETELDFLKTMVN